MADLVKFKLAGQGLANYSDTGARAFVTQVHIRLRVMSDTGASG